MPANTTPIFIATPKVQWALVKTANATASKNKDGTGTLETDIMTIFTAGTNGSRVDSITIHSLGTNVQTVISFFINNGSDNTTYTNNSAFYDVTLSATTISSTSALTRIELSFPNGINLQNGYKILASVGTTVATGYAVTAYGGDY